MTFQFTIGEIIAGLLAIGGGVAQFMMVERRLTKIETLVTVLVNRSGLENPAEREVV